MEYLHIGRFFYNMSLKFLTMMVEGQLCEREGGHVIAEALRNENNKLNLE